MGRRLKVVSDQYELSPEVEKLLHEISERRDNYRPKDPDSYYHAEGMILKEQIVKLHTKDTMYLDDLESLQSIDSMKISSSDKILTYSYYIPSLVTLEEAGEILESYKELEGIENPYIVFFYYSTLIINRFKWDVLTLRGLSENLREREYLFLFDSLYYRPDDKETVDLLYRLNKFLGEGEEGQSYEEFYRDSEDHLVIKGSLPDFSGVKIYPHSELLFQRFKDEEIGFMGVGVNVGVIKELEKLTREEYLRLLKADLRMKAENLFVFENAMKLISPIKTRSEKENHDIFTGLVLGKVSDQEEFSGSKGSFVFTFAAGFDGLSPWFSRGRGGRDDSYALHRFTIRD